MPGLVPGIHAFFFVAAPKTWMAGTSPAMTEDRMFAVPSLRGAIGSGLSAGPMTGSATKQSMFCEYGDSRRENAKLCPPEGRHCERSEAIHRSAQRKSGLLR
jgi:hypothetical protein